MRSFVTIAAWLLLPFLTAPAQAETLQRITAFQLEYSRSFQGEIRLEFALRPDGTGLLVRRIHQRLPASGQYRKETVQTFTLPPGELVPLLEFVNRDGIQAFFRDLPERSIRDGSTVALTVHEGTKSLTFFAQVPFGSPEPPLREFSALTLRLLKDAGLTLSPKEIY